MFYFLNPPSGEATYPYTVYRQALRDVTTQADPFAIVWPESPSS